MKTRRNAGLSMIEVVIASVIMVILITIVLNSLLTSSSVASKGSITSGLEERGRSFVNFCRTDFLQGVFTGTPPIAGSLGLGPDEVTTGMSIGVAYRLPGNRTNTGAPTANGTVVFGYVSPLAAPNGGFRQDLACYIRFEADTILRESSSASPGSVAQPVSWGAPFPALPGLSRTIVLNYDANRDGDRNDVYVRGKIKKYVVAPNGSPIYTANSSNQIVGAPETLSDDVIMGVNPATGRFSTDVDNDGVADMLFRLVNENNVQVSNAVLANDGRAFHVQVWHGAFDDLRRGFLIRKSSGEARWRNRQ